LSRGRATLDPRFRGDDVRFMTKTNTKICVGMIAGAQGIRGQVRLRSFTEDPEAIGDYEPLTDENGTRVFAVTLQGVAKDCFIASIDGVKDRNQAEALRGTRLYVDRSILPKAKKNQYYESDLIGLVAQDGQGKIYGKILATHDHGAGTFLEIGTNKKDSFMLPFRDAFVPEVDVAGGRVLIAPPEGWIGKDDEVKV